MLRLTNTLTRKKEDFTPLDPHRVTFYHCGPTVYWTQHIGNMRAVVMADVITRSLEYLDYHPILVRNYTDVGHLTGDNVGDADLGEDRMEKAVRREHRSPEDIARTYIDLYERHVALLNTRPADIKPRATGHIPEMISMVETLLAKDFAYSTKLAVYFDISKVRNYTNLSRQHLEENIVDAGKGHVSDPEKHNPHDFVLWFFKAGTHINALQTWTSPFSSPLVNKGEGFPGWHIECSAMIKKYLGDTIDIHMGGVEHIPIHHTNEIAQSESANGKPFVRYWLHNEHLLVDEGKMAKSEGTGYSLQEIIDQGYNPMALRYLFLTAHYRSKQNFTWKAIGGALVALNKLYDAVREYQSDTKPSGVIPTVAEESHNSRSDDRDEISRLRVRFARNDVFSFEQRFKEALEDDFNTPQTLAIVWDLIKSDIPSSVKLSSLLKFDKVLGLKLDQVKPIEVPDFVKKLIFERAEARNKKDFKTSDELRKSIEASGFSIEDTPTGVKISKT